MLFETKRRQQLLLVSMLSLATCLASHFSDANERIHTVNGPVKLDALNFSLTHEHLMSNFGKPQNEASVYDEDKLLSQVIPYLKRLKSLGVHTVFDCTANYFGRRVDLLKKISDDSGIQVVTNTGIYGAARDKYIPQFAYAATAESLAKIWAEEFIEGIGGTPIKPGFIKLGFDGGTPSDIDSKLFIAGILAHQKTGLKLAVHTGDNLAAAKLQMELLKKHKVDLQAWIWVHAHKVTETPLLLDAAAKGAWISLDGVKKANIHETLERLKIFRNKNLLHKILLSHDGNAFPAGGSIRAFDAIMESLLPAMLQSGFTREEFRQIMVENPQKAFALL